MNFGFRISDFGFTVHFPRAEPQRHRGTEKTQSRPTSQTRRHQDTKKSQSRPPLTEKPQITQINADSPRGFNTWRDPGRRTTAGDRRTGQRRRMLAFGAVALSSGLRSEDRRSRHFSPLFNGWEAHTSFPNRRKARRNRRAPGASAGGKPGCDERSRSEQTGFSPAVGDRSIADCSAVNLRHCRITSATTSLRLCAFAPLRSFRWVEKFPETFPRLHLRDLWANWDGPGLAAERLCRGKRATLRLCGSASLRFFPLCFFSVSLWFFGRWPVGTA